MYTQDSDADKQEFDTAKPKDMPGPEKDVSPKTLETAYQKGGFENRLKKMQDIVDDCQME